MDSSLAAGGWHRVRMPVMATAHELKKALFLCCCRVLRALRREGTVSIARRTKGGKNEGTRIAGQEAEGWEAGECALWDAGVGCGEGSSGGAGRGAAGGDEVADRQGEAGTGTGCCASDEASRVLLVTEDGVLLQVAHERIAHVMSGIESAFGRVEWPRCDGELSSTLERGNVAGSNACHNTNHDALPSPNIRCLHGLRFGCLM